LKKGGIDLFRCVTPCGTPLEMMMMMILMMMIIIIIIIIIIKILITQANSVTSVFKSRQQQTTINTKNTANAANFRRWGMTPIN
jgi:predicted PurR-regulated permease PerM